MSRVYQCRNDGGDVIYVGRSRNVTNRIRIHRTQSPWWSEVARIEEGPELGPWAGPHERHLIVTLRPKYNIQSKPAVA